MHCLLRFADGTHSAIYLQIELNHVKNMPIPPGWGADSTGRVTLNKKCNDMTETWNCT